MIYKCFMQCDRVCLNNINHAFQSYLHAIINDIVTCCVSLTILRFGKNIHMVIN